MKHRIWITIATYIAYCINKELYKAIEYLITQVEVLIEQQEKQNKRIAEKYDGSQKRGKVGRPPMTPEIVALVIRFKEENPLWGYQKITDQIVYLGYEVSKSC